MAPQQVASRVITFRLLTEHAEALEWIATARQGHADLSLYAKQLVIRHIEQATRRAAKKAAAALQAGQHAQPS